eukprot:6190872-Pleurochrysis_carterae.AAC.4
MRLQRDSLQRTIELDRVAATSRQRDHAAHACVREFGRRLCTRVSDRLAVHIVCFCMRRATKAKVEGQRRLESKCDSSLLVFCNSTHVNAEPRCQIIGQSANSRPSGPSDIRGVPTAYSVTASCHSWAHARTPSLGKPRARLGCVRRLQDVISASEERVAAVRSEARNEKARRRSSSLSHTHTNTRARARTCVQACMHTHTHTTMETYLLSPIRFFLPHPPSLSFTLSLSLFLSFSRT